MNENQKVQISFTWLITTFNDDKYSRIQRKREYIQNIVVSIELTSYKKMATKKNHKKCIWIIPKHINRTQWLNSISRNYFFDSKVQHLLLQTHAFVTVAFEGKHLTRLCIILNSLTMRCNIFLTFKWILSKMIAKKNVIYFSFVYYNTHNHNFLFLSLFVLPSPH